jgi:hypothetical protein
MKVRFKQRPAPVGPTRQAAAPPLKQAQAAPAPAPAKPAKSKG